ncbi:MAG: hypothetical protein ABIG68_00235, partial [Acidobacteriota bacterium]
LLDLEDDPPEDSVLELLAESKRIDEAVLELAAVSDLTEYTEKLKALQKEGRVLSAKNRKVIGEAIDAMNAAETVLKQLMEATEPAPKQEPQPESPRLMVTSAKKSPNPPPSADIPKNSIVPPPPPRKPEDAGVSRDELKAIIASVAHGVKEAMDKTRSEIDVSQLVQDRINALRGVALKRPHGNGGWRS